MFLSANRLHPRIKSEGGLCPEHALFVGNVPALALHWPCGAARCVRSHILGALSILKGAVPGRARGLGHMAPTYFRREPGIATPTAERLRTCTVVIIALWQSPVSRLARMGAAGAAGNSR